MNAKLSSTVFDGPHSGPPKPLLQELFGDLAVHEVMGVLSNEPIDGVGQLLKLMRAFVSEPKVPMTPASGFVHLTVRMHGVTIDSALSATWNFADWLVGDMHGGHCKPVFEG